MSGWHGGKGSKARPIEDRKKFEDNWDLIFAKKPKACAECGLTGVHKMDCSKNFEKNEKTG